MLISLSRKLGRTGKPVQGGFGLEFLSSTKVSVPILRRPHVTIRLVSMVDAGLFDKLDVIGRQIRCNRDKPFGGIQVRTGLQICLTFGPTQSGRLSLLVISFNSPLLAKEARQCASLLKLLLGRRQSREPSSLRKSFGKKMRVRTRFPITLVRPVEGI